jgi:hypothetical protein
LNAIRGQQVKRSVMPLLFNFGGEMMKPALVASLLMVTVSFSLGFTGALTFPEEDAILTFGASSQTIWF